MVFLVSWLSSFQDYLTLQSAVSGWFRGRKSSLTRVLSVVARKENALTVGGILYFTDLGLSTYLNILPHSTMSLVFYAFGGTRKLKNFLNFAASIKVPTQGCGG